MCQTSLVPIKIMVCKDDAMTGFNVVDDSIDFHVCICKIPSWRAENQHICIGGLYLLEGQIITTKACIVNLDRHIAKVAPASIHFLPYRLIETMGPLRTNHCSSHRHRQYRRRTKHKANHYICHKCCSWHTEQKH